MQNTETYKPKPDDKVSRKTRTRLHGKIVQILDHKHVRVEWPDQQEPERTIEPIHTLEMIERNCTILECIR